MTKGQKYLHSLTIIAISVFFAHSCDFIKSLQSKFSNKSTPDTSVTVEAQKTEQGEDINMLLESAQSIDDYKKIYTLAKDLADSGNVPAMTIIGSMYLEGQLGERDFKKAGEWLRKAAAEGHPPALFALGRLFLLGAGVKQDTAEAKAFFKLAATADYAPAIQQLAQLYYSEGKDDPKNIEIAKQLLNGLALKDNAKSMVTLGAILANEKNYEKSCLWYRKAAEKSHPSGQLGYGICHSEELIKDADIQVALKNFELAANQGLVEAQLNLGVLYDKGEKGIKANKEEAMKWYKKASDAGNLDATFNLGCKYLDNNEYAEAFDLFNKSGEAGHAPSQYELGILFAKGLSVQKDLKTSYAWYTKAAQNKYIPAQHQLGKMHFYGEGTAKDVEKAKEWFKMAADKGHKGSQAMLKKIESGDTEGLADPHNGHAH